MTTSIPKGLGGSILEQRVKDKDIRAIGDRILVSDMHFGETKTEGGLVLLDDSKNQDGIHPRWCRVYRVGPEQTDVAPGQWILVAHGRWSRAFIHEFDGEEHSVRMVDNADVLVVTDDEPDHNRIKGYYANTDGLPQMTSLPGND